MDDGGSQMIQFVDSLILFGPLALQNIANVHRQLEEKEDLWTRPSGTSKQIRIALLLPPRSLRNDPQFISACSYAGHSLIVATSEFSTFSIKNLSYIPCVVLPQIMPSLHANLRLYATWQTQLAGCVLTSDTRSGRCSLSTTYSLVVSHMELYGGMSFYTCILHVSSNW